MRWFGELSFWVVQLRGLRQVGRRGSWGADRRYERCLRGMARPKPRSNRPPNTFSYLALASDNFVDLSRHLNVAPGDSARIV